MNPFSEKLRGLVKTERVQVKALTHEAKHGSTAAADVADALYWRIIEIAREPALSASSASQNEACLAALYVLDMIVKNLPGYKALFEARLLQLFECVFKRLPELRPKLNKLLQCWEDHKVWDAVTLTPLKMVVLHEFFRKVQEAQAAQSIQTQAAQRIPRPGPRRPSPRRRSPRETEYREEYSRDEHRSHDQRRQHQQQQQQQQRHQRVHELTMHERKHRDREYSDKRPRSRRSRTEIDPRTTFERMVDTRRSQDSDRARRQREDLDKQRAVMRDRERDARRQQKEHENFVEHLVRFELEYLRRFNRIVIGKLYDGEPCKTCGLRFQGRVAPEHLDWHFRENNKQQKQQTKNPLFQRSRGWSAEEFEWLSESKASEPAPPAIQDCLAPEPEPWVPVDESNIESVCCVCTDPFEKRWDDEQDSWIFTSACLAPSHEVNGQLAHPRCIAEKAQ